MKKHLIPALAALLEKTEDVAVVVRNEIAEPVVSSYGDYVPSGQDRRRERRAKERKNKRK